MISTKFKVPSASRKLLGYIGRSKFQASPFREKKEKILILCLAKAIKEKIDHFDTLEAAKKAGKENKKMSTNSALKSFHLDACWRPLQGPANPSSTLPRLPTTVPMEEPKLCSNQA